MRTIPTPPAALLFDLDGTLLDTERLIVEAEFRAFARIGRPVTRTYIHQFVGLDGAACEAIVTRDFPDLDFEALDAARAVETPKVLADGIPLKPGVPAVLEAISAQGIARAIVTSSGAMSVARKFERIDLGSWFKVIVTADDVERRKPAPDPYVLAAHRLGVDPAQCIAFEDSETGARAAQAAGCFTVQIPDILETQGTYADMVADRIDNAARELGLLR